MISCLPCEAGSYSDKPGATACKPAPAGTFSQAAATQPEPCPADTYSPGKGASACVKCSGARQKVNANRDGCDESYEGEVETRIPVLALAGIGSLLTVACLVGVLVLRRKRPIFSASPLFLVLLCVGVLILQIGAVAASVNQTRAFCHLKHWLYSVGWVLAYGALGVKVCVC